MDYIQAEKWYASLSDLGIRPGLERIKELLERLGNPQSKLKYIHVAGTNGKGSFCSMISGILMCAGFKTGMFTSPFVMCFEEQLQVNGSYITKSELAGIFTDIKQKCDEMADKPTAFEVLTAAALLYFCESGCDFAVMECGMGGAGDCTNIIPAPEVAVLMSVSLDHTAFLGDSIKQIANEKCGIIKSGCNAVCYPAHCPFGQNDAAVDVFLKKCRENNVKGTVAPMKDIRVISAESFSTRVQTELDAVTIPFGGVHQINNFATVLTTAKALVSRGYSIDNASIIRGTENARMPARLEKISTLPEIILDGGHNPGCAQAVADFIRSRCNKRRKILVFAMMRDKDFETSFEDIAACFDEIIFTRADISRSESPAVLLEKAKRTGKDGKAFEHSYDAIKYALSVADGNSTIFICGSFYLAREAKKFFSEE